MLRITRKDRKRATEPLAPPTVRALDAYLSEDRPKAGSLFLDRTNTSQLSYPTAYKLIQRLAKRAGIQAAVSITPTACDTPSSPKRSQPALPLKTSKTPPAMPTPEPPGAMTTAATTSIAI